MKPTLMLCMNAPDYEHLTLMLCIVDAPDYEHLTLMLCIVDGA